MKLIFIFILFFNVGFYSFAHDLNFFSSRNGASFQDKSKSYEENLKIVLSKLDKSLIKQGKDGVEAEIPTSIASNFIIPKPKTKLYFFSGSKFLGVCEPIEFKIGLDAYLEEKIKFDIDWKKLNLSKDEEDYAKSNGIFISEKEEDSTGELSNPSGIKKESEITRLPPEEAKKLFLEGIEKLKGFKEVCAKISEFNIQHTYCFQKDGIKIVVIIAPSMCGEIKPSITIVKHDGIVDVFKDDSIRYVQFEQYFKIDKKRFLIISKYEDMAQYFEIYELTNKGAVLINKMLLS
ncbi:MAG TPA: hypothetical protein VMV05_09225 [bacterium]|nr:hypothetical protein [bacterium]